MSWLAYHNLEIDWKIEEVKMMRYPEECGKQWRPVQRKSGWEKQKEKEEKEEVGKKRRKKYERKERKRRRRRKNKGEERR